MKIRWVALEIKYADRETWVLRISY